MATPVGATGSKVWFARDPATIPRDTPLTNILIAVTRRVVNSRRAVTAVARHDDFFEDVNILLRSLTETVVNGSYLQFATASEVHTYLNELRLGRYCRYGGFPYALHLAAAPPAGRRRQRAAFHRNRGHGRIPARVQG
jgi:hypothetical protein